MSQGRALPGHVQDKFGWRGASAHDQHFKEHGPDASQRCGRVRFSQMKSYIASFALSPL